MRIVFLLLMLLVSSCKSTSEQVSLQEPAATPIYAAKPQVADVPVYVEALGSLHPAALVDVRARLNGIVSAVHVQEGQWVDEGIKLFELDAKPFAIKLEQAQAQAASAKARYSAAAKKLERFKTLATKNLISQNEWEQIETDCLQAKAEVALTAARLKEASLDLEYCTIVATKSGRVGTIDIHPGHLVSNSQVAPLAQIVSMDPIVVEFAVTEKDFCKLNHSAKELELTLLSSPEKTYKGTLCFTDNHFDAASGLILLRAKIANSEYQLRPGMSVKVKIPVGIIAQALLVPQKAVKHNQFGAFVYTVHEDGTAGLHQVQVAGSYGECLIVTQGLTADQTVITEGHQRVGVGSKVEVKL